jgi:hypothetical protein
LQRCQRLLRMSEKGTSLIADRSDVPLCFSARA